MMDTTFRNALTPTPRARAAFRLLHCFNGSDEHWAEYCKKPRTDAELEAEIASIIGGGRIGSCSNDNLIYTAIVEPYDGPRINWEEDGAMGTLGAEETVKLARFLIGVPEAR